MKNTAIKKTIREFASRPAKCVLQASLILAPIVFSSAHALEYECTATNEQRYIRLEMPGEEHLCEVTVTPSDGAREVKWYANSESSFCTEKTNELKGKYEELWGFNCAKWPDTDGIDKLSKRHRVILDAELKKQLTLGEKSDPNYTVKAVKAASSKQTAELPSTLALQYFISDGVTPLGDITQIIHDNGVTWFTQSRIKSLATYIPSDTEYKVNSALISTIDSAGTIEVETVVSDNKTERYCYGSQTFLSNSYGSLVPRSPHRFVCH